MGVETLFIGLETLFLGVNGVETLFLGVSWRGARGRQGARAGVPGAGRGHGG